jgi:hypothetical protein
MFNNTALDVFIGIVFIFLLYSLLATIMQEIIATRFAFRSKVLEKAILRMLEDGITNSPFAYADRIKGMLHIFGLKNLLEGKTVAPWFYAHPLIKYLGEDNYYSKPAYLDASNFSKVMLDLLKGFGQPESQAVQSIHNSIINGFIHKLPINISDTGTDKTNPVIKILDRQNLSLPAPSVLGSETVALNPNTALFLKSLWQDSGADINVFKTKLEEWFDDTMDRASGWYKKYTRIVLFVIGLVVAYTFNVDIIAIQRILSTNKAAREQMVQIAINNKDKLDPNKLLNDGIRLQSDSLLNATFKMVADDASKANNVLGLGRSWEDTCKICKDSLSSDLFKSKFELLDKENSKIRDSIKHLLAVLSNTNNEIGSLSNIKPRKKSVLNKINELKKVALADTSLLKNYQAKKNPEYDRMSLLQNRCAFIQSARKDKWYLYSPNQSGGWTTFFGWLITALAITLGAPFWFDLLSKLISLRGTGSKIASTGDDLNNKKNTPVKAASPANPVNINVNPNPGDQAVG